MGGRPTPEVLYLHPSGHLNDLVVPTGAVSCLNAIKVPRAGRYAFEVSDDEIRAARIVAMDLHWSVGLPGFVRLVRQVRAIHPRAVVVAGGITAGHYPRALLEREPVDFVIRGDSEVAFAALVDAVLRGRSPDGIANVYGRDLPDPPARRMTRAEFDASDPLTVDWFPTYARVTDWQSVAFSQGRTLPVARGCPFRCPTCYGSYADSFGKGYIIRSPTSVVERVRQAQELGVRHLRLIVGKPGVRALSAVIGALASAGPFRFEGSVGLYVCTPPSEDGLRALDEAFTCPVDLSVVPPEEHVPRLSPEALAEESAAWERVARFAGSSRRIHLDLWATTSPVFQRLRRELAGRRGDATDREDRERRVTVTLGAVWLVTRPVSGGETVGLDLLHDAMEPVWTFYAARLLSPSLARLLRPFQFLDALTEDPDALPDPGGVLTPFFRRMMENWRRHHVPTLPGIAFGVVPVTLRPAARVNRERHGTRYWGAMGVVGRGDVIAAGGTREMGAVADHRGVTLEGPCPWPPGRGAVAVIPLPLDQGATGRAWLDALAEDGLVVIRPARGSANTPGEVSVRFTLRVQDISAALLDASGEALAVGRADLGYYETSPRAGSGGA